MRLLAAILLWLAPAAAAAAGAVQDAPRFAESEGARIAYYAPKRIKGVPLLVLSGGPGTDSRYMWAGGALATLSRDRSLIRFDQRGTGLSSPATGGETIDLYVRDLEQIRQAVGVARLDLLGHSFGGYLAMAYAARYPQHVRGMVLVDSAPPRLADLVSLLEKVYPDRIGIWRETRARLGDDNASSQSAVFLSMEFVTAEAFRHYLAAVADHRDNMVVNNRLRKDMDGLDLWPQVRAIAKPTLVVHGRFDAVVAPSNSWQIHQAIAGSRFHIIESAGHLPHVEKPLEFVAAVKPFLDGLDREIRGWAQEVNPRFR